MTNANMISGIHKHLPLLAVAVSKVKLLASPRLLGRTTAGPGAAEEISVGPGLTLVAGVLDTVSSGTGTPTDAPEMVPFDATGYPDGVRTNFPTPDYYFPGAIAFLNGLALRPITMFTEDVTLDAITLAVAPNIGDELIIYYQAQP